jgi:hypothetical protein
MKRLPIVLLGLGATVLIPFAQAKETVCRLDATGDERRILIEYPTQYTLPCKTYYTRNGEQTEEAWAKSTPGVCERIADGIVSNLVAAKYECMVVEYTEKEPPPVAETEGSNPDN